MKEFAVYVTYSVEGWVRVAAEDEFEARCKVLDMSGAEIHAFADWQGLDEIEVSDNVEEVL